MRALAVVLLTMISTFAPAQFAGVNIRKVFSPLIGYVSNCSTNTSGNPVVCTLTGAIAGGTIVVNFNNFGNPTPTLTDSNSGTVSLLAGYPVIWDGGSGADFIWTIRNVGAGTHTLSISMTGTPLFPSMGAVAFSNTSHTSPVATSSNIFSTLANPPVPFVCANVTTVGTNAFVYTVANVAGGANLTPETSPILMTQAYVVGGNNSGAYGVFPTSGTNSVFWHSDAQLPWVCDTVVLH